MPIKIDRPHLENISKYIRKMMTYTEDVTFEEFQENQMVYDACILNFINLAESFKLLSDNFKVKNLTLPYHQINCLRNIAAHTYEGLDPSILYDTIKKEIPILGFEINRILKNEF